MVLAGISASLSAQSIDKSNQPFIKKTIPFPYSSGADRMSGPDTLGLVDYTDFLPQFAPFFSPVLYQYVNGGYVFGNNGDSINICAQGYKNLNNTPVRVLGVLLWFAAKESDMGGAPSSKVVVKTWRVSPDKAYNTDSSGIANSTVTNAPGPATSYTAPDASADILYTDIDTTAMSSYTYVSFAVPPTYAGDFAVGVDFSTLAAGDTAGLVSDTNNDAFNLDYAYHLYQNKWFVTDHLYSSQASPYFGSGGMDNNIAIWAVIDTAQCYSYYTTAYDSLLNTFNLSVDPAATAFATAYHWDFGDGSTSTLPNPTHVYALDTLYNVCMKIYTAAGDSCEYCHTIGFDSLGNAVHAPGFTLSVTNPITTSVNVISNENTITVFPNPFSSQTTLSFSTEQTKATIIISDILGKEVRSAVFSGKQYTIEKEELKPGIYFVKTIDVQKRICISKIIIH